MQRGKAACSTAFWQLTFILITVTNLLNNTVSLSMFNMSSLSAVQPIHEKQVFSGRNSLIPLEGSLKGRAGSLNSEDTMEIK